MGTFVRFLAVDLGRPVTDAPGSPAPTNSFEMDARSARKHRSGYCDGERSSRSHDLHRDRGTARAAFGIAEDAGGDIGYRTRRKAFG